MNFLNHYWLWALPFLLLIAIVLYLWGDAGRRRILRQYLSGGAVTVLSANKRALRRILLLGALFFLGLAAARPWWGERLLDLNVSGNDVLVVFDVSKSMLAQDVAPSRIEHAKWLLSELIRQNPSDRFGIIAFAGRAFASCPLTSDRVSLEQCIAELNTDLVPIGGTNLADALGTAIKALNAASGQQKTIVLFTDGEELYGSVAASIAALKKTGIELLIVGLGSPDVPALIPELGNGGQAFKRDGAGELVRTRLNEPLLRDLAVATNGIYLNSTAVETGLEVLTKRLKSLDHSTERELKRTLPIDRFMFFLIVGTLLLAAWFLLSEVPTRQRRGVVALVLGLGLAAHPLPAGPEAPVLPPRADKVSEAAEKGQPVQPAAPPDAITVYNQAREFQLAGKNEEARQLYESAIASGKQPAARDLSLHNLGVLEHGKARGQMTQAMQTAQSGGLDEALKQLDAASAELTQAEELYVTALAAAASKETAAVQGDTALAQQILLNDREKLEKIKKALEELKKQQQQAQQKTQQASQKNQDKKQQDQQQQGQQDQQKQQGQDQQKQQGQQGQDQQKQQGQQDQNQQQQEQQGQDQQKQQGQQGQDQQKQQGQQGQDQQKQQGQQGQDQKSQPSDAANQAREALKDAQQAVDQLRRNADKMDQKQLSEQARKAAEELNQAAQKQQKQDFEGAQKNLEAAERELGAPQSGSSGDQNKDQQQGEKQQQKQSGEQQKPGEKDAAAPKEQGDKPLPAPPEKKEQSENKMDEKQTDALLDLMSQDEKLLRDAIKSNRNRGIRPVEKDW